MQSHILLNMQSHCREATGTPPFDKYAESQSRSNCCAVTVVKRLLPHFVKYAEPLVCIYMVKNEFFWNNSKYINI